VFFVLGNHDVRVDSDGVRRRLGQSGFVDLGGREHQLDVRGVPVLLAGNEAPWFGRPGQGSGRPPGRQECPAHPSPLRIALAHSPDQVAWARRWNADLLLVGHTHGGQIRIPPLGPIFSPCLRGVKHYSGIYHLPPTILHVTQGVSGDIPVRWNCKPEIALLTLRRGGGDLGI
jgi:predicted MPP superfamily phosphohydrolase